MGYSDLKTCIAHVWQGLKESAIVSFFLLIRRGLTKRERSIWNKPVGEVLTEIDGGMLSRAGEHDERAVLGKHLPAGDLLWEATPVARTREGICVKVF